MFMAVYIFLAIAALAGLTYGIVQYTLEQPPWSLWADRQNKGPVRAVRNST